MTDFLLGFAVCYAIGAAIELRNVLLWHRETGHAVDALAIIVSPLMWPMLNWIEWEES